MNTCVLNTDRLGAPSPVGHRCRRYDAQHLRGVDLARVHGAAMGPVVAEIEDVAELCALLDRPHHFGHLDVQGGWSATHREPKTPDQPQSQHR